MQKVRKGVILAAGLGTRVLPATKAIAKELIPIVDKPAIQYIVEEMTDAGIEEILIVLSPGKSMVCDHFSKNEALEAALSKPGKEPQLEAVKAIEGLAHIEYAWQQEALGTGHAAMHAKEFANGEAFVLAYGDDVFICDDPATAQVCRAYEQHGKGGALAIKEVPTELVMKYSSMKVDPISDNLYTVSDMIEKPKPDEMFSNFSILGRVVLPPRIFDILEVIPRGAGNEFQLTDAMKVLAREEGMIGVDFTGTRYDMGNKFGILKASIETALSHPEIKDETRQYIKELAKIL